MIHLSCSSHIHSFWAILGLWTWSLMLSRQMLLPFELHVQPQFTHLKWTVQWPLELCSHQSCAAITFKTAPSPPVPLRNRYHSASSTIPPLISFLWQISFFCKFHMRKHVSCAGLLHLRRFQGSSVLARVDILFPSHGYFVLFPSRVGNTGLLLLCGHGAWCYFIFSYKLLCGPVFLFLLGDNQEWNCKSHGNCVSPWQGCLFFQAAMWGQA